MREFSFLGEPIP